MPNLRSMSWWLWMVGGLLAAAGPPLKAAEAPADDVRAARRLLLTGKYDEAQEVYDRLRPADPLASALGRARCQAARGQLDEAEAALAAALPLAEALAALNQPDAPLTLAADLHAERAALAFGRGQHAIAEKHAAAARAIDGRHLHARWLSAELLRVAGQLDEANAAYKWFVDYYNDHEIEDAEQLRWIGLAAAQYARWNRLSDQFTFLVNDLFPDALAQDANFWPAAYEAGLLFLEKYNEGEAGKDLRKALKINANAAEVHAALARLALQNYNLEDARRSIDRALELNPKLLEAHLYRADSHLANFEARQALQVLEAARDLNPVSEELLGRLAAAYAVLDGLPTGELPADFAQTRAGRIVEDVSQRNPHCGVFCLAMGSAFDLLRKFPLAARYYHQAIERMPQLVEPRGQLGLMHMRLGNEAEARKLLDASFEVDPFNVRVSNSLKVLEVLDTYAVLETDHFVIRFDRAKDEILARYVARHLEEKVYPALCQQFAYEPPGKSLFEIFSRARNTSGHGWFSARMVGLPYIGTVGACAGKMVALASPNDMERKYNWARVLGHEFVHVLNLQQTDFNIPHWYTEALAVQSEGFPRPQSWNEMLAARVPKGQMFNLDTINLGFVRPKSPQDWQMAYCQAQLYAQYMLATYGEDALARMLRAYADNLDTRAALLRCFQVKQEDFEKGYLEHVQKLVADLGAGAQAETMKLADLQRAQQARPDDPDLAAQLARAYVDRQAYPEARKLAEQALAKSPRHGLATYVMARVRLVIGDDAEAVKLLEAALDREQPEENCLLLLAGLKLKAEDYAGAAELYELGARRRPHDLQWTKALARVYLKSGDQKQLATALARLAEADADELVMRKKLAQLALAAKEYEAAADWAEQALHIDVMDVDVHRMLAEAAANLRDHRRAIEEYEVAVRLDPKQPGLRFALANACVDADQIAKAREVLQALLKIEPEFPGAAQLLEGLAP